jgi:hypothetical protein
MNKSDEITLTLPREREFQSVAHLVLGGIAMRHELTIEMLEDLQLAVGALLDRLEPDGDVEVTFALRGDMLEARIGPMDVDENLGREFVDDELSLGRVLWTVADDVSVEGRWIRVAKRLDKSRPENDGSGVSDG